MVVATKLWSWRQNYGRRDKTFVGTKICFSRQDVFLWDKQVFVATEIILVAAPAIDMCALQFCLLSKITRLLWAESAVASLSLDCMLRCLSPFSYNSVLHHIILINKQNTHGNEQNTDGNRKFMVTNRTEH